MKKIEKDGIYKVGEGVNATQIQYTKGTEVADDVPCEYVAPWPKPAGSETQAEVEAADAPDAKAANKPENKQAPAPDNKSKA